MLTNLLTMATSIITAFVGSCWMLSRLWILNHCNRSSKLIGMGRDQSRHKVLRCFFKVELSIIVNDFLNISLLRDASAMLIDVPLENAQNMRSVWTAWFQFWHKHNLRIDVLFFCSILNEQRIQWVQLDGLKKSLKYNETYLHLHRISRAPLIGHPDRDLKFGFLI